MRDAIVSTKTSSMPRLTLKPPKTGASRGTASSHSKGQSLHAADDRNDRMLILPLPVSHGGPQNRLNFILRIISILLSHSY